MYITLGYPFSGGLFRTNSAMESTTRFHIYEEEHHTPIPTYYPPMYENEFRHLCTFAALKDYLGHLLLESPTSQGL